MCSGTPPKRLERGGVTAQQRRQVLVQHEAGPQHAAVAEHQREQPDDPLRPRLVGEHRAEMREVDLRLTPGRRLEAHLERRAGSVGRSSRSEVGQNAVAAGVAEIAQLAMQADRPVSCGKRRKPLAQIARERRDLARPWRPRTIRRRLQASLDVFVHRLAVEPHLAGDRRDAQLPADAIQGSSRPPQVRPTTRPSAWKGAIISHMQPTARRRLLSAHLGKIQSAHLGIIPPALTVASSQRYGHSPASGRARNA